MSYLDTFWFWCVPVLGLMIGSFLNVVGLRFLSEESITFPASHCTHCNTPIKPYDNIPVLSYLLLGAKCRSCKVPISIQYPLIELLTAVLFTACYWIGGWQWGTLFLWFLMANLVVIIITDARESLIFQINSLSLVPAGLLFNFFDLGHRALGTWTLNLGLLTVDFPMSFTDALLGILVGLLLFEGMILLSQLFLGTDGFGHGDTHLMMGVGAFIGWQGCLLAIVLGFILQSLMAIPIMVIQWIKAKDYLSLGTGGAGVAFGLLPLWLSELKLSQGMLTMALLACMGATLTCLIIFLLQIKKRQSFTYMPLGPALVLGSLIVLFLGDSFVSSIAKIFHLA
ncbi:MAG: prepilin peptidase [Cyanobacteria bacterium]|nr:prepilin peptidase [Cyanobacteriota bacterium]